MDKKAIELSMNTVIVAAIGLMVLVVIILIFRTQIGNVAESFGIISSEGGRQAEQATWDLSNLFGCKEDATKCRGNEICKCIDDKWQDCTSCGEEKKCVEETKTLAVCE